MRLLLLLCLGALVQTGCSGHALKGRVVRGAVPGIQYVPADDGRLSNGAGIMGARIRIDRDPDTLGRKTVATGESATDGRFVIPVDAFGAGWLQEVWAISAGRHGFEQAERTMALQRSDEVRLLITLPAGRSQTQDDDLWDQYEQYR